jgi:hypothetical protein
MAFSKQDAAKPLRLPRRLRGGRRGPGVRVRVFSPLGVYPQHPIVIPGARLLVRNDLIVSAVEVGPPKAHGLDNEHFSELEFLALEEIRFLAGIVLAVHPDNGMAYTYPLREHVDVGFGLDDDALIEAAQQLAARISGYPWWRLGAVLPPCCGGPPYDWREGGVNVDRVLNIVSTVQLNDHLLMRGLGALLQADMCWRHREIEGVAVLPLYVALEVSFQMVLQFLREQGVSNATALDAGALVDAEVFNHRHGTDSYFGDFYEDRIKTTHPSSRFGVFAVPALSADDYLFLRHSLVEVYHWLITKQRL